MGLFSSSNKSANTTNNSTDNSSINLNAGGTAVDGNNNRINITDGGAFDLVGKAFNDSSKMLADGVGALLESQNRSFSEITDLSRSNKEIESKNFLSMLDSQSGFSSQALDYSNENNARAINAVINSNDRVSETVQKVNAANSGDMSQTIKQVSIVLVVGVVSILVLKRK
jgi:hypothetical protein